MAIRDFVARYNLQTPTVKAKAEGIGELSDLEKNPFQLESVRYPLEGIGSRDVPHYVMFNINLPTASKYVREDNGQNTTDDKSASTIDFDYRAKNGLISNKPAVGTPVNAGILTAGGELASGGAPTGAVVKGIFTGFGAEAIQNNIQLRPQLKRISKSIAIYLPDTQLTAQYEHGWGGVDLTSALGITGIASSFQSELNKVFSGDVINDAKEIISQAKNFFSGNLYNRGGGLSGGRGAEVAGSIASLTGAGGPGIQDLIMRSANRAMNPQVQMLFSGTANREFNFEFDFQARSHAEADAIQDIIFTFKRFAAPEIAPEGLGRYFIPPAQFDIKFYFKAGENPFIAKISTCVLTRITVDYNKSPPFASFEDGHPVHINLQLWFKEVDIMTRELIENFGY